MNSKTRQSAPVFFNVSQSIAQQAPGFIPAFFSGVPRHRRKPVSVPWVNLVVYETAICFACALEPTSIPPRNIFKNQITFSVNNRNAFPVFAQQNAGRMGTHLGGNTPNFTTKPDRSGYGFSAELEPIAQEHTDQAPGGGPNHKLEWGKWVDAHIMAISAIMSLFIGIPLGYWLHESCSEKEKARRKYWDDKPMPK